VARAINDGQLQLTSKRAWFRVKAVRMPRMKYPHDLRRFVGGGMLLFVFFLPLHFHFSVKGQVAKECSCVQGTRTQLALASEIPSCAPILQTGIFKSQDLVSRSAEWTRLRNVRAPPALLSV
jgi:hypothetical protein